MSITDKAYKKMKNIYGGCNSYNDEKKLYSSESYMMNKVSRKISLKVRAQFSKA